MAHSHIQHIPITQERVGAIWKTAYQALEKLMTDHMIAENAVQDVNFLHKKKELKTSSFFIPEQVQGARSASLCIIPQRLICARGGLPAAHLADAQQIVPV